MFCTMGDSRRFFIASHRLAAEKRYRSNIHTTFRRNKIKFLQQDKNTNSEKHKIKLVCTGSYVTSYISLTLKLTMQHILTQWSYSPNSNYLCLVFALLIIIYVVSHSLEYVLTQSTTHFIVQTETEEEKEAATVHQRTFIPQILLILLFHYIIKKHCKIAKCYGQIFQKPESDYLKWQIWDYTYDCYTCTDWPWSS